MNFKFISVVFFVLVNSACTSKPTTIKLDPKVTNHPSNIYTNHTGKVLVNDLRKNAHIVEVLSSNKPPAFINTNSSLRNVLSKQFSSQLTTQGMTVNKDALITLKFNVERARTYVNQDVLDYRSNTIIKLKVHIENPVQTLSKTFTLRATTRGALTADIDELEQEFNIQLGKLITQVVEDEQLQDFIKG